ncbi:MAG: response regulator transcription factor [Gemmiger sp.]|nr:response regulator transcription factor [Gemmiger sp.]
MANILAVDDEPAILAIIQNVLGKDGHRVTAVQDPRCIPAEGLARYDLILLDVMMPHLDGFALCKKLRACVDCPILFLTAKTDESALVQGLETGADDYIGKPFGAAELRARVSAHLRRETREHFVSLAFAGAHFNLSSRQLVVGEGGPPTNLTKSEYAICEFLARNQGQVFSKEQIYENIFGLDGASSDTTIATHIKNIRAKLDAQGYAPIKTVWGIGYKWDD